MTDTTTRIDLEPAGDYWNKTYGIVLNSTTRHDMTGPGIHNRHHPHRLDVWENRDGRDPHGEATTEPYTYLLKAEAVAITAHPQKALPPQGDTLRIGDRVDLYLSGYCIGTFEVKARPLHDPHLERVA